jgi:hypothetical protein
MALAAVPAPPRNSGQPSANASKEPNTLRELYDRARADLAKPAPDALLRWVFWHARGVGRLEVARSEQKRVWQDRWEAEMRSRSEWMLGNAEQAQLAEAQKPVDALIAKVDKDVEDAAAFVQAAHDIAELLKVRR